ncbi:hypothetical protein LSH36_143g05059 [Paralvinella palmiformis]|uniref:Uncharacterized protein n=1 Tax=Paralvinella palmiformis TaxID=53620 RepID=A0AAD9JVU3_9ANNE|nr:hypothetical protein LSH36_143g05059 [Paralvinella palmiformis]
MNPSNTSRLGYVSHDFGDGITASGISLSFTKASEQSRVILADVSIDVCYREPICEEIHLDVDSYNAVRITPPVDAIPLEGSGEQAHIPPGSSINFTFGEIAHLVRIAFQLQGAKSVTITFIDEDQATGIKYTLNQEKPSRLTYVRKEFAHGVSALGISLSFEPYKLDNVITLTNVAMDYCVKRGK